MTAPVLLVRKLVPTTICSQYSRDICIYLKNDEIGITIASSVLI